MVDQGKDSRLIIRCAQAPMKTESACHCHTETAQEASDWIRKFLRENMCCQMRFDFRQTMSSFKTSVLRSPKYKMCNKRTLSDASGEGKKIQAFYAHLSTKCVISVL